MVKKLQLECMSPGNTIQLHVQSYLFFYLPSLDSRISFIFSLSRFSLSLYQLKIWVDRRGSGRTYVVHSHLILAFFNSSASYCLISDSSSASHFIPIYIWTFYRDWHREWGSIQKVGSHHLYNQTDLPLHERRWYENKFSSSGLLSDEAKVFSIYIIPGTISISSINFMDLRYFQKWSTVRLTSRR